MRIRNGLGSLTSTAHSFAIQRAQREEQFSPSLHRRREPILVATIQTNSNFDNHPESLRFFFESGVDLEICCDQRSMLVLIRRGGLPRIKHFVLLSRNHFGPMEATVSIAVIKEVFVRHGRAVF